MFNNKCNRKIRETLKSEGPRVNMNVDLVSPNGRIQKRKVQNMFDNFEAHYILERAQPVLDYPSLPQSSEYIDEPMNIDKDELNIGPYSLKIR